jgi:hypothetical protein
MVEPDEPGRGKESPATRRSASAEAAALRWSEGHPDEDSFESAPPSRPAGRSDEGGKGPPRRSASAEAAALRWEETHPDDDA